MYVGVHQTGRKVELSWDGYCFSYQTDFEEGGAKNLALAKLMAQAHSFSKEELKEIDHKEGWTWRIVPPSEQKIS
ncbi:hypothetical protein MFLO_09692 [Listeria floridensis FSL S10-1187]|uniref:Uncharacterized protein n=2 Tax=Listeria floridensis TaxID=1494962 RepID=A0ABP3AY94_9LIST|nr:hypothetical protein MFLO_09692 [Listeria floridensis FSL S10-1187]